MSSEYPLNNSETERQRLAQQALAIEPLTQRMLKGAGIQTGSRVLELGCGTGEVTKLLAQLVGQTGKVTAIDGDEKQIASAQENIPNAKQVEFLHADISRYDPTERFDAIVGRYILIYLQSPEAILQKAAEWLAPNGSFGFIEMDLFPGVGSHIWPPVSEHARRAIEYIGDIMLASGAHPYMSARLPSMLAQYGEVQTDVAAPVQFGPTSLDLPFAALRSVIPRARALNNALAEKFDVDKILNEEKQGRDNTTTTTPPLSIAAWVKPTL